MSEPLAYRNGEFLPVSQLAVPVYDAGFVLGATVSEQMRTFHGRLFRVPRHMERLRRSLEIVGVRPAVSCDELAVAVQRLATHNHRFLDPEDDLALVLFVTPGPYPAMVFGMETEPMVAVHTYPLPFRLWEQKYDQGQHLRTTSVRQVPRECWPAELKCRSRIHYYLADREAARIEPGSRALMLDDGGRVVEASTANVVVYRRAEGLVSPPREKILPGISLAELVDLAAEASVPFSYRDLTVDEITQADEVMLTSTSPCLLPVTAVDGEPIGSGKPGPVFRDMLRLWAERVGVNIAEQAKRFRYR